MSTGDVARQVEQVTAAAVADLGLLVEEVTVTPAGRRRVVRVSLDRNLADLGAGDVTRAVPTLSMDDIAVASQSVSAALDSVDLLGDSPYVLEVSSPGVGRPLREPRHYRGNVRRLVEVTLDDGSVVTGRLIRAGEHDATVADEHGDRLVAYANVVRAQVQVEFSRPDEDDDQNDVSGEEED